MRLTIDQFKQLFPHVVGMPDTYTYLSQEMAKADINTDKRENYFLAQLAHECGGFRWIHELASGRAYEGRKSLGNTQPGDGVRFKGRGWIQVTGRYNYTKYGNKLGLDLVNNPDLAGTPEVAAKTACAYWVDHNLNAKADQGDYKAVTKAINGGLNGYQDRLNWLGKIRAVPTLNTQAGGTAPIAPKKYEDLDAVLALGFELHYKGKIITPDELDEILSKKAP